MALPTPPYLPSREALTWAPSSVVQTEGFPGKRLHYSFKQPRGNASGCQVLQRGSWENWQRPAKGKNSCRNQFFWISVWSTQARKENKMSHPSLWMSRLIIYSFSPNSSYCLLVCVIGHGFLPAWGMQIVGPFFWLSLEMTLNLEKVISFAPSFWIQYCQKSFKLKLHTQRERSKSKTMSLERWINLW